MPQRGAAYVLNLAYLHRNRTALGGHPRVANKSIGPREQSRGIDRDILMSNTLDNPYRRRQRRRRSSRSSTTSPSRSNSMAGRPASISSTRRASAKSMCLIRGMGGPSIGSKVPSPIPTRTRLIVAHRHSPIPRRHASTCHGFRGNALKLIVRQK